MLFNVAHTLTEARKKNRVIKERHVLGKIVELKNEKHLYVENFKN
jgi:hypothetical protein